jgi:glycopeptide antibiotics resistance protein
MNKIIKKWAVFMPVLILTFLLIHSRYYPVLSHIGSKRELLFIISIALVYAWILIEIVTRKQSSGRDMLIQASFFIYIFMVLVLTGYFGLFREIASHDWWHRMIERVHRKDHVNLKLFQVFKIYHISDLQVAGNFIMLVPLAIYLPVLYRRMSNIFVVVFTCLLVSVFIEVMQLFSHYRSCDVDDVLLNTSGALMGYILFRICKAAVYRPYDKALA